MKSFVEFVSCCVKNPEMSTTEEVVASPRREETRTLMAPKMAALRRKKKRVKVGTPFSTTPEWKPSLHAISEDTVMAEKREKMLPEAATTANRAVKRKSMSGSLSKIHVRSHSDDMG
ncbi:uncharacterized protein LOC120219266 [Hibiscus syriacus]|uniref:uncharacterized protein LOC120219266 n=1 Tax=Hibiscus syriacus TaxID=106335 RepID=UPI001920AE3F|nr:uncharacterized protein LOC120219266 [Hibiscus syriacus]